MIARILAESEYERNFYTNTHNNDETVQVAYIIDSDYDNDEGSKCDMEY